MIGYKLVAVINGEYRSVFDGSKWEIGVERYEWVEPNHKGGLYVYDNKWDALEAEFPPDCEYPLAKKALLECECRGHSLIYHGYRQSDERFYYEIIHKYAFEHVKPIREVE